VSRDFENLGGYTPPNWQRTTGDEAMARIAETQLSEMLEDHDEFIETGKVANPYRLAVVGDETQIFDPVVFTKKDKIHVGKHCRIDGFVKIEGGELVSIGDYVHIASFAHINVGGGATRIGYKCAVASHAVLVSGGNRSNGLSMSAAAPIEDQVLKPGVIVLDDFAVVLVGAVVLPNVTISQGAVVGAGSFVKAGTFIPPWEIWGGNPARFLMKRELRHDMAVRWSK
jgi:acetyltransferase-like isoleucine patch superfamily enzyme